MNASQREAVGTVSDLLARAGYRPAEPESFKRGAAALMAAQMVALAAGLTDRTRGEAPRGKAKVGRNDPCPCGSGKKYKKCCLEKPGGGDGDATSAAPGPVGGDAAEATFGGVVPAMIPRIALREMQADTVRLAELFRSDPDLRLCRFPVARVVHHLSGASAEAPTDESARDQWLADQAHAFVQAELERGSEDVVAAGPGGEDGPSPREAVRPVGEVMLAVKDALLGAAARAKHDLDQLRALALGLLFHSSWSPASEAPHPLEALLFRLTLHEAATEQAAREQVIEALGEDADVVARRLAVGDPAAAKAFSRSFETLSEGSREELLAAAARYHDQVVDAIVAGGFPVPLPLVSVLPLVIETVQVVRRTDAGDAKRAAQELAVQRAREGLSAPDRELYAELCDQWLAGPEAEDEDAADMVRYARSLAGSGGTALEAVLLLAFLDHHRVTPLVGEPNPDPAGGVEIDSPAFLEEYGTFLTQRGNLKLALRTWRLCTLVGDIPPPVQHKIQAVEETLASQN